MSNSRNDYVTKTVHPSFHLEVEEYRELFEDFLEAFDNNVIAVGIVPPKVTKLILNKNQDNIEKSKAMRLGLKIISIGSKAKTHYPELELGDLAHVPNQDFIIDADKQEITVKGVFPSKRSFTAFVFAAHNMSRVSKKTANVDTVKTEEREVHKDIE